MLTFIFAALIMGLLVTNSSIVITGATKGLMLWYQNILPLLLPFILISNVIIKQTLKSKKGSHFSNILITIMLGCFCGYPIGAKCTLDFVNNKGYSKEIGNIILPLCNNLSPMFLSGYISVIILESKINTILIFFLIYAPYLLLFLLSYLIYSLKMRNTNIKLSNKSINNKTSTNSAVNNSISNMQDAHLYNSLYTTHTSDIKAAINQITTIGVYIIICSILSEFILAINISSQIKTFCCSLIEITRGVNLIKNTDSFYCIKNTALILATTSFGGLSSILQTKSIIANSELSLIRYIFSKVLCGITTYFLVILLI